MATTATAPAPSVPIPRTYNIATAYIDDLVTPDRVHRTASIHGDERVTCAALRDRINRAGNAFRALGVEMEQRVALLLPNQPELVAAFFGAATIGAVAAPMSAAVTASEQIFLLNDSRARALVAAEPLWQTLRPRRGELPFLKHFLLVNGAPQAPDEHAWAARTATAASELAAAPITCDDTAFWRHTAGSTGTPKWAVHLHRNVPHAEQGYATPEIGLRPDDVRFASGPLSHAYPLGLATYFALRAGATVVLHRERPTPARVFDTIARYRVTVFAAVPTLYAQLLHAAEAGEPADFTGVRLCLSAAEPLPADPYRRFRARFGVEVLDGIGTAEALHVFMSNRLGDVRPGSSGRPVPGYEVGLLDDGNEVSPGEEERHVLARVFAEGGWILSREGRLPMPQDR